MNSMECQRDAEGDTNDDNTNQKSIRPRWRCAPLLWEHKSSVFEELNLVLGMMGYTRCATRLLQRTLGFFEGDCDCFI
jgi:hypothetical protein